MGEEGGPRVGWGLKETKPPLYLPREAQGWRLPVAQWSGAIPSPKPLSRPVSAPPLAHKWGVGGGTFMLQQPLSAVQRASLQGVS